MKVLSDGIRLGTVAFIALLTFKFLAEVWREFWGFIAGLAEKNAKKKASSMWDESVNAEVADDGK